MWDEIYQRHYPELVRYAASVCKDLQQAEDVAQEVFLKALQSADVFEDLSDAQQRAWLYRALKNYMIDCFRRAKLESEYLDMIPEEAAYDDSRIQETENQLLLATLAPVKPVLTLILLTLFLLVMNVILFRAQIFGKKKVKV